MNGSFWQLRSYAYRVRNGLRKYTKNHVKVVYHLRTREKYSGQQRAREAAWMIDQNRFLCKWNGDDILGGYFGANAIPDFIYRSYMKRGKLSEAAQSNFIDRIGPAFVAFVCTGIYWELLRIHKGSNPGDLSPDNCKSESQLRHSHTTDSRCHSDRNVAPILPRLGNTLRKSGQNTHGFYHKQLKAKDGSKCAFRCLRQQ